MGTVLQTVGLPLVFHSDRCNIPRSKGETLPYPTVYRTSL